MCRSIKTLHNFEPPATDEEIRDASLQFARKLCGFTRPSKAWIRYSISPPTPRISCACASRTSVRSPGWIRCQNASAEGSGTPGGSANRTYICSDQSLAEPSGEEVQWAIPLKRWAAR